MKHQNLFPVDTHNVVLPGHFTNLKKWMHRLPALFSSPSISPSKVTLLCGIPGVGKGAAVRVIAKTLGRPLFLLDGAIPLTSLSRIAIEAEPSVLWVDCLGDENTGLLRWLQTTEATNVFVVFTTDAPHRLPPVFTRADVVDTVWHLDLPTLRQRSGLWGELLFARITGPHTHDSVKLGQLSGMFTPAEIGATYDRAVLSCGAPPNEGALIDAVLAMKPLALRMDEGLACLRAWAREHALGASSGGRRKM